MDEANKQRLALIRQQLEAERQDIREELTTLNPNHFGQVSDDYDGDRSYYQEHMADMASDVEMIDRSSQLQADRSGRLHLIEEALERMTKGTYGHCQRCGKHIKLERLEAQPFTEFCLPCEKDEEVDERAQK